MNTFKRSIPLIALILTALSAPSFSLEASPEANAGTLNIYSKIGFLRIYIDNDFYGETPVEIDAIKAGTHLVAATKNGETVYEEIVTVKDYEVTTIMVTKDMEKPTEQQDKEKDKEEAAPPKGEGSGAKTSKTALGAFYGKLGYMSSSIYSFDPDAPKTYYSSSLSWGGGFKLYLDRYVGVLFEMTRSDLASPDDAWYIMPASITIQLGYPVTQGFSGLYYYSLGIGYFNTDLEDDAGNNLTCIGFTLASGLEFPISDNGSAFIEIADSVAENSKAQFDFDLVTVSFGLRMNI